MSAAVYKINGIDHINARRKWKRQWRDFRHDRVKRNRDLYPAED